MRRIQACCGGNSCGGSEFHQLREAGAGITVACLVQILEGSPVFGEPPDDHLGCGTEDKGSLLLFQLLDVVQCFVIMLPPLEVGFNEGGVAAVHLSEHPLRRL